MPEHTELSGLSGRQLKKHVRQLLASDMDIDNIFAELMEIPARAAVNPLFACFYDRSPLIKWRAVAGMGVLVARLAERDMESARVVMRRLMWNLNDESGGIGWGSPEAMAEIMARQPTLADEYGSILGSYVRRDQNFLEHEGLQRGSIWAVGRLAQIRPELLQDTVGDLEIFLTSSDPHHRGYAVWAIGNLRAAQAVSDIKPLLADASEIEMFRDLALITTHVSRLAKEALAAIENGKGTC